MVFMTQEMPGVGAADGGRELPVLVANGGRVAQLRALALPGAGARGNARFPRHSTTLFRKLYTFKTHELL